MKDNIEDREINYHSRFGLEKLKKSMKKHYEECEKQRQYDLEYINELGEVYRMIREWKKRNKVDFFEMCYFHNMISR